MPSRKRRIAVERRNELSQLNHRITGLEARQREDAAALSVSLGTTVETIVRKAIGLVPGDARTFGQVVAEIAARENVAERAKFGKEMIDLINRNFEATRQMLAQVPIEIAGDAAARAYGGEKFEVPNGVDVRSPLPLGGQHARVDHPAEFLPPPGRPGTVSGFDHILEAIRFEVERGRNLHGGMFASLHEAYGVLLEELDELWEQVRLKKHQRSSVEIHHECVQIAAVAIKSIISLRNFVADHSQRDRNVGIDR